MLLQLWCLDKDRATQFTNIVSAKGHVLGDIEPGNLRSAIFPSSATCSQAVKPSIPEIEIVNRSLLISHIDVEGKEVDGS